MSWDSNLLGTAGSDLPRQIDELFAQQRASWKALREGEQTLQGMTSKVFTPKDARIVVQANPGRLQSTIARVDPESVARRPCFLCPEHLPAEERGLAFGDLVVLPNPCPVVPRHCTIPAREHSPQRLARRIPDLLNLARALGPGMLVFYNGPRCGASAPDHFHFQACDTAAVPLFSHLPESNRPQAYSSFGRRMLVANHPAPDDAGRYLHQVLDAWSDLSPGDDEPLVGVLGLYREERYLTVVFPREKHRPECFFAPGDARIAISPAALEMAGILVVAEPDHFDKVDLQTALSIYQEVSLDKQRFAELARMVT